MDTRSIDYEKSRQEWRNTHPLIFSSNAPTSLLARRFPGKIFSKKDTIFVDSQLGPCHCRNCQSQAKPIEGNENG